MIVRIAVLINVGHHPITGRPCRAPNDARALELALQLPKNVTDLRAFHAGCAKNQALQQYLGMGLEYINVLEVSKGDNPYPALLWALKDQHFDLILTGTNNHDGLNSGLVPYALGHDLNRAVISDVCQLSINQGRVEVLQSLPKGQRLKLTTTLPAIITVGDKAARPRQNAFGRAKRGRILPISCGITLAKQETLGAISPAKKKARQIHTFQPGASAEQRLEAVMGSKNKNGKVLTGLAPEGAAKTLLDYLVQEKIFDHKTKEGTIK